MFSQLRHSISTTGATAALLAAASLLSACSSSPQNGEVTLTKEQKLGAWLEYSLRYVEMGEFQRAIDQARQALEIDPKNSRFLLLFAETNLQMRDERGNQTIDTVLAAKDALDRIEGEADWRVENARGEVEERLGLYHAQAADAVQSGRRTTKSDDPAKRADELTEIANEHWEAALSHYQAALTEQSGQPKPLRGLVRTTGLMGRREECVGHARDLVEAIRASQRLVGNLLEDDGISAKRESELYDDQRMNRGLEIRTRMLMAQLLRQLDRPDEAVAELDEVIDLDPSYANAHAPRAQLLMELGEFRKAKYSIDTFLQMKAQSASFDDPEIRQAFDLQEQCARAIQASDRK